MVMSLLCRFSHVPIALHNRPHLCSTYLARRSNRVHDLWKTKLYGRQLFSQGCPRLLTRGVTTLGEQTCTHR